MTTGEKLALLRKRMNLTQDELAELMGVSRQTVSKWEQDVAFPETGKLLRLSKLFGCSVDFLLDQSREREEFPPGGSLSAEDCRRFIRECGYFFLATCGGGKPDLRPMGMIWAREGSLFFVTDKRKRVYGELMQSGEVTIAAYNADTRRWLRVRGSAHSVDPRGLEEELTSAYPALKRKYRGEEAGYIAVFRVQADSVQLA